MDKFIGIKQGSILEAIFKEDENLIIPKKNLFTLNQKNVYDEGDDTWKAFRGEVPTKLIGKETQKNISDNNAKIINKESFGEFVKNYEILIDFYNKYYNDPESIPVIGNTYKGLSHKFHTGKVHRGYNIGDSPFTLYLLECFDYTKDFNDSEKLEFEELIKFYNSIWTNYREEIYGKDAKKVSEKYKKIDKKIIDNFEDITKNLEELEQLNTKNIDCDETHVDQIINCMYRLYDFLKLSNMELLKKYYQIMKGYSNLKDKLIGLIEYCTNLSNSISIFINEWKSRINYIGKIKRNYTKHNELAPQAKKIEEDEKVWAKIISGGVSYDTLYLLDNKLRHGIVKNPSEDKYLGYLTGDDYSKVKSLFQNKKKQLDDIIEIADKKIEILKNMNTIATYPAGVPNFSLEQKKAHLEHERDKLNKIKGTDKEYVNKSCNTSEWTPLDNYPFTLEDEHKIYGYKGERKQIGEELTPEEKDDILYQFVDWDGSLNAKKYEPLPLNKRQYVYGFTKDINKFGKYRGYFRVQPFIYLEEYEKELQDKNLVNYSILNNKFVTFCTKESDSMFPIRFILPNQNYAGNTEKRILQKTRNLIDPIKLLSYKIIGVISYKKKIVNNGKQYIIKENFIILKDISGEKKEFHPIRGEYSHFAFLDFRLQRIDKYTLSPLKNITWDEFNIMYSYLNVPLYILQDSEKEGSPNLIIFGHNNKYKIPPELMCKLRPVTKEDYIKFDISYKNFYQNNTSKKFLLAKSTDKGGANKSNYFDLSRVFSGGGKKINKNNLLYDDNNYRFVPANFDINMFVRKNQDKLGMREYDFFLLFDPFLLLRDNNIHLLRDDKISSIFFGMDKNINLENYEMLKKQNLINKDNLSILEISNQKSYTIDSAIYEAKKKNYKINTMLHLFTKYQFDDYKAWLLSSQGDKEKIDTNPDFVKIFNQYITKDTLFSNIEKFDLIINNLEIWIVEYDFFREEMNLNMEFILLIYSILRLNKNGNLMIKYGDITINQSYQIINNFSKYFDEIIIDVPITKRFFSRKYTYVFFKGYKNNFDLKKFDKLIEKIFLHDPTLGINFMDDNKHIKKWDDTNKYLIYEGIYQKPKLYLENYSVNKEDNKKLLKNILDVQKKKYIMMDKFFILVKTVIGKFLDNNISREELIKYNNYLRIICSFYMGLELKLIDDEFKPYIDKIVKKIKQTRKINKTISDYANLSSNESKKAIDNKKIEIIQEVNKINNDNKNYNLYELFKYNNFMEKIFNYLENYEKVHLEYDENEPYEIKIITKNKKKINLNKNNKIFIHNLVTDIINEILDIANERQFINYYLKQYNL